MKIFYLSNANNYHTIKWAKWFAGKGHEIHIASLEECVSPEIINFPGITVHWLRNGANRTGKTFQKLRYLQSIFQLRGLVKQVQPDILHAHYASSYGLLAALTRIKPYYLSVWGNDVYSFPRKSLIHKLILIYVLSKASWLLSTSQAMADEAKKYSPRTFTITPFGIDTDLFKPLIKHKREYFVVGTVKGLETKYGIDKILYAVNCLKKDRPDLNIMVRIAGTGTQSDELRSLADELNVADRITWLGHISQPDAAIEWANMDVAVVPSNSESFGVSALEAMATETPLIISDLPGLLEATGQAKHSLTFTGNDIKQLSQQIIKILENPTQSLIEAKASREFVKNHYDIDDCFQRVLTLYENRIRLH